jgi:hypothetical protein
MCDNVSCWPPFFLELLLAPFDAVEGLVLAEEFPECPSPSYDSDERSMFNAPQAKSGSNAAATDYRCCTPTVRQVENQCV